MSVRKDPFVTGEIYHCYNRGVDKRNIFTNRDFFQYFLDICSLFNQPNALGGIREYRYTKNLRKDSDSSLVTILAYCLNPNHYHLLLRQEADMGISKFMQKVGTGYTMYFNKQHKRSGGLFQGKFKSQHIHDDAYLRHVSVYVTYNNIVHNITDTKKFRSSALCYEQGVADALCDPNPILSMFEDLSEYQSFARSSIEIIRANKEVQRDVEFETP